MRVCYLLAVPADSVADTRRALDAYDQRSQLPRCKLGPADHPDVQNVVLWLGECNPLIDDWLIANIPIQNRTDILAFLNHNKYNRVHVDFSSE